MKRIEQDSLLIVDGDPVGCDDLIRRFEQLDFMVTGARSGQQAIELLRTRRWDLILLNTHVPGIDGFELLKVIRTVYPATDLPVIVITEKEQSEDIVRALQLGANDYISRPCDFQVVLASVQNQLSLNKTAHMLGVFRAQFQDCLEYFFPDWLLESIEEGELVRWHDKPLRANYRLGDLPDGLGVGIEWLRHRYRFRPKEPEEPEEWRLIEAIVRVLDTRYRAVFDLSMPNRLVLLPHAVEDWVIAEYLRPLDPLPVLEVLKMLRLAALLTYENRKVSLGALLLGGETEATSSSITSPQGPLRLDSRLLQVKSFLRVCDGLHTLFLADNQGNLRGVIDIEQWARHYQGGSPLSDPSPRPYENHARATLSGGHIALILTPFQEIKAFANGTLTFAFRGARWHLLDIPAKYHNWCQAVGPTTFPGLPKELFQIALNLMEAHHGALFVVLDRSETSLPQLVRPENRTWELAETEDNQSRPINQALGRLLQGASIASIGLRVLEALASIDGAVVMDRSGKILAAGAILRVSAGATGESQVGEGARTTAARAASCHGPVLRVSEDGLLDMFRNGQRVWQL